MKYTWLLMNVDMFLQAPKAGTQHAQQAKEGPSEPVESRVPQQAQHAQEGQGTGAGLIKALHPTDCQVCP